MGCLAFLTFCMVVGSCVLCSVCIVEGRHHRPHVLNHSQIKEKRLDTRKTVAYSRTSDPSINTDWLQATATWYGSPTGTGTDGGACGYGNLGTSFYGSHVSAGSPVLFKAGLGCGACYEVKCLVGGVCSSEAVTVSITDECPGGYCSAGRAHFDMGGAAFGAMALSPSFTQNLLNVGVVEVLYRRVPCSYAEGRTISFQVNEGATNYWFSILIRNVGGDGDVAAVDLMERGQWRKMEHLWGAYWCLNAGPLEGPFSVRVTTSSGASLDAFNVIPANWVPGQTYFSLVNF
ncbi:hypothetical protein KP509_06G060100 [Ceratopteris richardii]|uniref:Expansin n=1 Tax=Ceratopteris richardii TaxID=49495 RepID=A0A8T2UKR4_CERRI|nr:hypothetical protein KP509_06G060100 [Ceratopteris richardii]